MPASRFESPRRALTPGDLEGLLRRRRVVGLAEMMNFPGVIAGDPDELAKLRLEGAGRADGHAPGVTGKALNAYAAAGIGSDHEAATLEEGRERLRAGMWLLIREASAARNLQALLPLVEEYGTSRIAFCTDDREPEHIADDGHVNSMVRDAVAAGVAPEDALVHGDAEPGALARPRAPRRDRARLPRRPARPPRPRALRPRARAQGRAAAWGRSRTPPVPDVGARDRAARRPRREPVRDPVGGRGAAGPRDRDRAGADRDRVARRRCRRSRTVASSPTRRATWPRSPCIERHLGTGRIGLGLVQGLRPARGALASTIAHDAHNLVVVGMSDADMRVAVERLAALGGGICVAAGGKVTAELPCRSPACSPTPLLRT